MDFEIIGELTEVKTIASGTGVRDRARLTRTYGRGRWRKRKGKASVRLPDRRIRLAEVHWYEAHGIGKKGIQTEAPIPGLAIKKKPSKKIIMATTLRQRKRVITTKRQQYPQFAVCINNEGYKASLELGKLYRIVPDKQAQTHGLVRVIDESGEDYAYAANRFQSMKVSSVIEKALSDSHHSIPKSIRLSRP